MNEYQIIAAIMAGVYAGNFECLGMGFAPEHDFGADSINHLYEYMDIGKNIEIPYEDDGETINTEAFREEVYLTVKNKYCKEY